MIRYELAGHTRVHVSCVRNRWWCAASRLGDVMEQLGELHGLPAAGLAEQGPEGGEVFLGQRVEQGEQAFELAQQVVHPLQRHLGAAGHAARREAKLPQLDQGVGEETPKLDAPR